MIIELWNFLLSCFVKCMCHWRHLIKSILTFFSNLTLIQHWNLMSVQSQNQTYFNVVSSLKVIKNALCKTCIESVCVSLVWMPWFNPSLKAFMINVWKGWYGNLYKTYPNIVYSLLIVSPARFSGGDIGITIRRLESLS